VSTLTTTQLHHVRGHDLPRTKSGTSIRFWGTWSDPQVHIEKLSADFTDEFIKSEYLTDIKNLALICQAKYWFVGLAFRGAAATILCYITIVLLTH
jgi:hypothetical protein